MDYCKQPFKYEDQVSSLNCCCPPTELCSPSLKAYRFVNEDLNHKNNYLPPLLINPTRINEHCSDEKICSGYALSFYTDLSKAERQLKKYLERKRSLAKTLGSSIGSIELNRSDGLMGSVDKKKHFDLFEFKSVILQGRFTIERTIEL